MIAGWVAWRIRREILRDRRTLAFYLLSPLVVMTLVYAALVPETVSKVGLVAQGTSILFKGDFENALIRDEKINFQPTGIGEDSSNKSATLAAIRALLNSRTLDAVLWMDGDFILDRFKGQRGSLKLLVEGSRPTATADVLKAVADAMDELNMALPVVADATCGTECLESFNSLPVDLEKIYLHGDENQDSVDYYLPLFPAFFVFFFTYITSAIAFQRERKNGTLERLAAAPMNLQDVVSGYLLGFLPFAAAQAVIVLAFIFALLEIPLTLSVVSALAMATGLGMMLGLLFGITASLLAQNEFQVMQTIPLLIIPQIFLSDMIWDINRFPIFFQGLARIFPLTYLNHFVRETVIRGQTFGSDIFSLAIACMFLLVPLMLMKKIGLAKLEK